VKFWILTSFHCGVFALCIIISFTRIPLGISKRASGIIQRHSSLAMTTEIELRASCDALSLMNPVIKRFIVKHGYPSFSPPRPLSVFTLTRIICGQQIGASQAKTISKRVEDLVVYDKLPDQGKSPTKKRKLEEIASEEDYGGMTAKTEEAALALDDATIASKILKLDQTVLKSCGLSQRKTEYIIGIAKAIDTGDLVLEDLHKMDDATVEQKLVALKGIGPWSAHMLLIFTLSRQDVWPIGDEAVRGGLRVLFDLKKRDKKSISLKQDIELAVKTGEDFIGHRSALAKLCYKAYGLK
jgi:3-methyladenine DNA glycosylase/8-oxoguanine DNA glycosylase